jgi:undecaprenyl pyrophosphate phosphatase UppP
MNDRRSPQNKVESWEEFSPESYALFDDEELRQAKHYVKHITRERTAKRVIEEEKADVARRPLPWIATLFTVVVVIFGATTTGTAFYYLNRQNNSPPWAVPGSLAVGGLVAYINDYLGSKAVTQHRKRQRIKRL